MQRCWAARWPKLASCSCSCSSSSISSSLFSFRPITSSLSSSSSSSFLNFSCSPPPARFPSFSSSLSSWSSFKSAGNFQRLLRAASSSKMLLGGMTLGLGSHFALSSLSTSNTALCENSQGGSPSFRQQLRYTISDAVERVAASVVSISYTKKDVWVTVGVAGSGFIIDADGTILTNAHVVEGSSEVLVTLHDGQQLVGRVENYDSLSDVAIVKIKGGKSLQAAKLGKSSDLRVGEWIIAYGSPGELKDTVTVGIVSALLRQSSELGLGARRMSYIQTDAAINQGNSGGPLINLDGEVVGISTMKAAYLDGISFAIPIDLAMDMVRQMRKYGYVRRPHLGMKIATISPMVLAELRSSIPGFPPELKSGVIITDVSPNSPASKAGLQGGDVIQEINGSAIVEAGQIYNILGDEVITAESLQS